jgi:hypothetical protein
MRTATNSGFDASEHEIFQAADTIPLAVVGFAYQQIFFAIFLWK